MSVQAEQSTRQIFSIRVEQLALSQHTFSIVIINILFSFHIPFSISHFFILPFTFPSGSLVPFLLFFRYTSNFKSQVSLYRRRNMRFTRTVTAGVLLVVLSSLASRANARATDPHAVAVARSKLVAKCTIAEAGCVDASSSSYDVWNKRALPKFGDDGDALGGADAGEGSSGAAGIGGTTTGETTESGGTAEIGGVGGGDTSDSDTGGVAVDAGAPPSEDGSADTSSSEGSQSTSDDQFPQGSANQPVVDIVGRGYGSTGTLTNPGLIAVTITTPLVAGNLDILEVDTTLDSIGVKWAINDLDTIENNPGKVPLRSILADTWQSYGGLSGKQMSDLKSVNYQVVVNENMMAAFPLAYQAAGKTFVAGVRTPLTVTADTVEGSAYNILMGTTFGTGAQKMIAETAGLEGRTINSIDLFPTDPPNNKIDVRFNF